MPTHTNAVTNIDRGRIGQVLTDLEHEVALLQLRAAVTRLVSRDASQWVCDDMASLDLIVKEVAAGWSAQGTAGEDLADLEAFWNQYANRVEWAPPDSGNEYREEFCPASEGGPFDTDGYFHAVWAAHVAELRGRAEDNRSAGDDAGPPRTRPALDAFAES